MWQIWPLLILWTASYRGCGKLGGVVIFIMYATLSAGKQAALVVPTEILAGSTGSLQNLFPGLYHCPSNRRIKGGWNENLRRDRIRNSSTDCGGHMPWLKGVHYQGLGLVIISSTVLGFPAPYSSSRKGQRASWWWRLPYSPDLGCASLWRYGCVHHWPDACGTQKSSHVGSESMSS